MQGSYSSLDRQLMRINIGQIPPKCTALLKMYIYTQVGYEDLSYSFRLPMAYIPKYLGNLQSYVESGVSL